MVFVKTETKTETKMKTIKDEKLIREMKRMEIGVTVAVIVLCATLILRLADGDWLGSIANIAFLAVVYNYFRRARTTRLLMHYIDILETERDYNEKRIETFQKKCDLSEQMIANKDKIISNQEKIIANKEEIIKSYEREKAEGAGFMPSEGGGE